MTCTVGWKWSERGESFRYGLKFGNKERKLKQTWMEHASQFSLGSIKPNSIKWNMIVCMFSFACNAVSCLYYEKDLSKIPIVYFSEQCVRAFISVSLC